MRRKTVKTIVLWGFIFIFGMGFGFIYPHVGEMLSSNDEVVELVGAKGEHIRTDAGTFVGQIDNNSIEIKVNNEPKAFQLSERMKENIQQIGLQTDDRVVFSYVPKEKDQLMIIDLKKMEDK